MDTCALNDRNGALQHAQGLAVSLLLHAMVMSAAILLLADLHLTHQPDVFKWDVAMVEAPSQQQPQDNPTHAPTPAPTQAKSAPVTPPRATPRHIQKKTIETQPIVHTVQPVQQVVRQEVVHTQPLAQTTTQATHQSTVAAVETPQTISRSTQVIEPSEIAMQDLPVQSAPAPLQDRTPIEKETAVSSTPHEVTAVTKQITTEATPLSSSESAVVSRPTVEATQASPIMQERVVKETAPTLTESTTVIERAKAVETPPTESSSTRELPVRSTPFIREAETKTTQPFIEQAKIPGPLGTEPSAVRELPPRSRPQTKADFGWLTRALLTRIEQLKRYPQAARLNHWEGKVVLRAVIREDGGVIVVDVAESSGHVELDDDAVEIMRKASPLELTHPLGQSQVVVRIPIRYKLE